MSNFRGLLHLEVLFLPQILAHIGVILQFSTQNGITVNLFRKKYE